MVELSKIGPVGGSGGETYAFAIPKDERIVEVYARADWYVDGLICYHSLITDDVPYIGGEGGVENVFVLAPGEYITGLSGRYGIYIDTVKIHTSKRESVEIGGNGDGGEFDYALMAPEGHEIVGLFGTASDVVNSMGIITRSLP